MPDVRGLEAVERRDDGIEFRDQILANLAIEPADRDANRPRPFGEPLIDRGELPADLLDPAATTIITAWCRDREAIEDVEVETQLRPRTSRTSRVG